ncbi:MAG: hypothetical protein RJB38_1030 [Pseudomonadota bacterium]|jgi:hypothetical protein
MKLNSQKNRGLALMILSALTLGAPISGWAFSVVGTVMSPFLTVTRDGFASTASSLISTEASKAQKEAAARLALEEAAQFYDSGKISGVLNAAIALSKKELAEDRKTSASQVSTEEAVDHIVDVAQASLERQ